MYFTDSFVELIYDLADGIFLTADLYFAAGHFSVFQGKKLFFRFSGSDLPGIQLVENSFSFFWL